MLRVFTQYHADLLRYSDSAYQKSMQMNFFSKIAWVGEAKTANVYFNSGYRAAIFLDYMSSTFSKNSIA